VLTETINILCTQHDRMQHIKITEYKRCRSSNRNTTVKWEKYGTEKFHKKDPIEYLGSLASMRKEKLGSGWVKY
jgi:hypothetical protein